MIDNIQNCDGYKEGGVIFMMNRKFNVENIQTSLLNGLIFGWTCQ
jgi:hypothetical protein